MGRNRGWSQAGGTHLHSNVSKLKGLGARACQVLHWHGHGVAGLHIEGAPESGHLRGSSHGDADVFGQAGEKRANQHVVLAQVIDYLVGLPSGINHHKICNRIDGAEHASVYLIH